MMATAQGASSASMATNGVALTATELREILEYEKIVQFRDAVVAGTHPHIRIHPYLVGKQVNNSIRNVSSPNPPTTWRTSSNSKPPVRSVSGTYHERSSPYSNNRSPNNQRASSGHVPISSKSEINPILLEKSDDLIKAEIQLQRQRLERSLREQIEQQRLAAKHQTSDAIPNFDVAEVLSKALAIVHPALSVEAEPSVDARSSSDSFDNNTFYSSQHDTPEPSSSSQGQQEPLEVQAGDVVSVHERPAQNFSGHNQMRTPDLVMTGASLLSTNNDLPGQSHSHSLLSPLQHGSQKAAHFEQAREIQSLGSSSSLRQTGEASKVSAHKRTNPIPLQNNHPLNSTKMGSWLDFGENDVDEPVQMTHDKLLQQAPDDNAEPALIRAHNLSPFAPQPARVSPLATARNPPIIRENLSVDQAPQAAQVAALRKSGISSTDSSPNMAKPSKIKDKKKKKRKAKDDVPTPDSPYIKPEPRSPSPFPVAPLPRPQKRQRQTGQYGAELNYDEPRYEEEIQERVVERLPYQEAPINQRYDHRYEPESRQPGATYQRLEREDAEYRRVSDSQYPRKPQSPGVYALPYAPDEVRPARTASHAVVDRRPREEVVYYREPLPRANIRPDADRERSRSPIMRERRSPIPMAPPPRKPIRIVVDAYGREYIDPTYNAEPTPSMRQSVPPPARYRDAEFVYERAPVRTVSGRALGEYEEDGNIYPRPSPAEIGPRRVVTQHEYAVPENRAYHQREYSVRPIAPPGEEYIQLRGAPERRQTGHLDEVPREYVPRAASVRPAPLAETARYEIPREFVGRVQSVRPEGAPREVAPQSQREYSVRPVETSRREQFSGRERDRYYEEVPSRRPAAEIAFIERPRAREHSVLVYADDVRREVRDVYR